MSEQKVHCWIYRSSRKEEMYLYLLKKDGFDELPKALMELFGQPALVMGLELTPQRKLAREDAQQVINSLKSEGFFLQMPPKLEPELYEGYQ